ncbi:hypothetical protein INR49_020514 [Caranx melampygus]|nr:hypothetical protein INR49_020514 [Caranx melampygus]
MHRTAARDDIIPPQYHSDNGTEGGEPTDPSVSHSSTARAQTGQTAPPQQQQHGHGQTPERRCDTGGESTKPGTVLRARATDGTVKFRSRAL